MTSSATSFSLHVNSKSNKSREVKFVIAISKNKYYIKALYQHQTPEGF